MISKKIIVEGRVQGVGFRYFVWYNAVKLGLRGYVKNNINGSVESIIEGDFKTVLQMIELIKQGPPGAVIKRFAVVDVPEMEYQEFKIKY